MYIPEWYLRCSYWSHAKPSSMYCSWSITLTACGDVMSKSNIIDWNGSSFELADNRTNGKLLKSSENASVIADWCCCCRNVGGHLRWDGVRHCGRDAGGHFSWDGTCHCGWSHHCRNSGCHYCSHRVNGRKGHNCGLNSSCCLGESHCSCHSRTTGCCDNSRRDGGWWHDKQYRTCIFNYHNAF